MVDFRSLSIAVASSNVTAPIKESPSQTAGPYVHIGCLPNFLNIKGVFPKDLTSNGPLPDGERIVIKGHIFDGDGAIAKDIMVESWQADASGNYENGIWLRAPTHLETGEFVLETIVPDTAEGQASFLNLWVVARGINVGLQTRIYFEDRLNDNDPVLNLVPDKRKSTLIAKKVEGGYWFDIRLQGEGETVFFDV